MAERNNCLLDLPEHHHGRIVPWGVVQMSQSAQRDPNHESCRCHLVSIEKPLDEADLASQAPSAVLRPKQELREADERVLETSEFEVDPPGQSGVICKHVERVDSPARQARREGSTR
jgi:hypothetical protein